MDKRIFTRECKICSQSFDSLSQRAIYCSEECFKIAYRDKSKNNYLSNVKQKNCKYCEDTFFGRRQESLCEKCKGKHISSSEKTKVISVHCHKCDGLLEEKIRRDYGQNTHQKGPTCKKCKEESREKRSIRMRENNPNPLTGKAKPKKIKETKEQLSQRMKESNPMFKEEVSSRVSETLRRRINSGEVIYKKGEGHHLWKGNRDRAQTIRTRLYKPWVFPILERDNFTCCNCGQKGGRLEVHHISPSFREILEDCLGERVLKELTSTEFEFIIKEVIEAHKNCLGITYCGDCHKKIDPCRH